MICNINVIDIAKAFQIVGSSMLLFYSIPFSRKKVLKLFFNNGFSSSNHDLKKIFYNHNSFMKNNERLLISWISIIYIFIGFVLDYFAKNYEKSVCCLLLATFILFIMAIIIAKILVKNLKTFSKIVTYEELYNNGLKTDIEAITIQEIDSIFNENNQL